MRDEEDPELIRIGSGDELVYFRVPELSKFTDADGTVYEHAGYDDFLPDSDN